MIRFLNDPRLELTISVVMNLLKSVKRPEEETSIKDENRELYKLCVKGKIDSSIAWTKRCGVCFRYCEYYRERRVIGSYKSATEKKEVINEQSDHCLKYGHERIYNWMKWSRDREEERSAGEKVWRKIG